MPKLVNSQERRVELADAAARVNGRRGIDGASLRSVAAEAGWTTGALVPYFATKRELLACTLEASLGRLRAEHAERSDLEPSDALRALLCSTLPTSAQRRPHWTVTLAFAAHASTDAEFAEIQQTSYLSFRDTLADLVRAAGRCPNHSDAAALDGAIYSEAERLIAAANGVALQALFAPDLWTVERQVAAIDQALST